MKFNPLVFSVLILLTQAACSHAGPGSTGVPSGARSVSLVYFADLHAQLEEHPELFWSKGQDEFAVAGGLARMAQALKQMRARAPGEVMLMDAGDTIQGSGPAAWSEGAVVVPALNALGIDLAVPGNWEVVDGTQSLKKRAHELNYPRAPSARSWAAWM